MRQITTTAFFFLLGVALFGQTTLSGSIRTLRGEGVVGANISIIGTYDGATSDTSGYFSFKTYETGTQQLQVLALGCDTFRQQLQLDGKPQTLSIAVKEQRNELREVVVSAGTFEAAGDKRRATVLTALDIVLTASASADIAGAITMLPGTTRNGETGQILVRGGAAYETRTFIDGLLVQNPYNSTVGNLPARNRFSPFLFKGTLFSTGGYSAEYGQAMSSALILQTEDLAPKTTTGITLLSVGGGLAHTHRWERSSLSVSGSYNNLQPYFSLIPQRVDWIKPPQSGVGEVVYRRKMSENGGMLKVYANMNRSGMRLNFQSEDAAQIAQPLRLRADNLYTNISYRDVLRDKWTLFTGVAFTHNIDDVQSSFSNVQAHGSVQARMTVSRSVSDLIGIKAGGEWYKSRYKEQFVASGSAALSKVWKEELFAGFAESDLFFSRKFVGKVGARYEHSALLNHSNVAPRASFAYILGKKEQISLAFGRFYQTPEYAQMRQNVPNRFEDATHLMLNYQVMRNGYIFRVEGYQKWYNALLKTVPENGQVRNSGNGYARGIDVFFRDQKNIKNGDYWLSYSYLDTKRNWRDFPIAATPHFAMKHSFSAVYKQFFPAINTALSASYAFNSGRPYFDPNLPAQMFHQSRTPVYHDLSIAVTYLTNVKGHFTVIYLSVQNVLGATQVFGYQYSSAPDANGLYQPKAVTPPAKRFAVLACIMSIGQQYKKSETTSDDY